MNIDCEDGVDDNGDDNDDNDVDIDGDDDTVDNDSRMMVNIDTHSIGSITYPVIAIPYFTFNQYGRVES